jgi:hypothetical protein
MLRAYNQNQLSIIQPLKIKPLPYDQAKIQSHPHPITPHQILLNSQQQGQPREYDIKVDELKVVQRTNDPEQFFRHEEFILPDTQSICITLYEGTSNRNSRHLFVLNEADNNKQDNNQQSLDGIEKMLEAKMDKERQQWNLQLLQKENESLKQQLEDAEEYTEQLEGEITALKEKKFEAGKNIGAVLSGAFEALVRNNPSMLKSIPGGEALAGLLTEDNRQDIFNRQHTTGNVAFKKKNISPDEQEKNEEALHLSQQSAATGLDPLLVYQLRQLQDNVPQGNDRETLHKILQVFASNPKLMTDVWELFDEAYRKQVLEHELMKKDNAQERVEEYSEINSRY